MKMMILADSKQKNNVMGNLSILIIQIPIPVIIQTICWAVNGSRTWARTSLAIEMNRVQNTLLTCSFFPNASITASVSAFIARWISLYRNPKSAFLSGFG